MKKTFIKAGVTIGALALVSVVGFGAAFGYGGGGSWAIPYNYNQSTVTTPTVTAPVGQVLGATDFQFNSNLGYGMSNDDVKQLQTRLTSEGVYTGPITGYFGKLTLAGVKAYQKAHNIPTTGFVGTLTRAALNG